MKKSILSNPAFRYIFEVFVIIFSVTISFYIQDILNERDKMELKNESLKGVLIDSDKNKSKFMDIENYKNIKSVNNNVQFIAWLLIINLTCILCYIIYQRFN